MRRFAESSRRGRSQHAQHFLQAKARRCLGLERLEKRLVMATVTWTGGAGNGAWASSANWDSGALPTSGDDVVIPDVGDALVTYNNVFGASTFNTLVSDVPFRIPSFVNPLNVTTGATFNNMLRQAGGTMLGGNGDVTINGSYIWEGGTLAGAGTAFANGGIMIVGSGQHTLSRTLEVDGFSSWTSGPLFVSSGGVLRLVPTSALNVLNGVTMTGTGAVENQGVVHSLPGEGVAVRIDASFTNDGEINVRNGRLLLSGGLNNYDAASKTLTGGTYLIVGELSFDNASIATNSATIALHGSAARVSDNAGANAFNSFASNITELTLDGGASINTSVDFSNSGQLMIGDASSFDTAGTYTQTAGSTLLQANSLVDAPTLTASLVDIQTGVMQGGGTIVGDVINGGQLVPAGSGGVIFVDGNYIQTGGGTLDVELGGAVTIDDVTVTEGAAGGSDAVFTVSLSLPSTNVVTVKYATADGTASAEDGDYIPISGTLIFSTLR